MVRFVNKSHQLASQITGTTSDFKMDVIKKEIAPDYSKRKGNELSATEFIDRDFPVVFLDPLP